MRTPQQELALAKHCRLAFETMNPQFHGVHKDLSVILTVNSGYE